MTRLPLRRAPVGRRVRLTYCLVGLLLVFVSVPAGSPIRLLAAVDCSTTAVGSGPGFCVVQQGQPIHLTVGTTSCCPTYFNAAGLTYVGTENVRDGSGNTFNVQHLRFTSLTLLADSTNPVNITQPGTHYNATLTDPGPPGGGQDAVVLGGIDSLGHPMYTDMWGTVNDLRVLWWFACQANLAWGTSFLPPGGTWAGCHIDVSVYAIKVTDSDPASGQLSTPLKIPNGHLTVTST